MGENERIKEEVNLIIKEYGSRILSEKMVCKIIKKSPSTLARWRKKGIKLEFRKDDGAKNNPIDYSVATVARYLVENFKKVN